MIPVKATTPTQGCWCWYGGARPKWFYREHFMDIHCGECPGGCSIQTIKKWPDGFEKLEYQLQFGGFSNDKW